LTQRNSFFHYVRLDKAAADAGKLDLQRGLAEAEGTESSVIIETGGPLNGIRALFADEVFARSVTADYEDGEMERLIDSFKELQPALNRFAQAVIGRYLRELPDGVVRADHVDATLTIFYKSPRQSGASPYGSTCTTDSVR
jgi:hypothetical protein